MIYPLQAMKRGDVNAVIDIFTVTAIGRGRVASPTLGRFYLGTHFYGSGPQDETGHEGVKKNLHSSDTRARTRAMQPVVKHLAA